MIRAYTQKHSTTLILRLRLVRVKAFPKNISFSGKENVFRCLAASEFVLWKINSGVWFVQTFYGKWLPFYGKSIPMFVSVKHLTENKIRFLRKINSHVWFVDHFTENNNFKHLHYLNKPVTVQKYSFTSTSKIIISIQASALPRHICNSTKIFIHFNIKNNHLNIPIIFK